MPELVFNVSKILTKNELRNAFKRGSHFNSLFQITYTIMDKPQFDDREDTENSLYVMFAAKTTIPSFSETRDVRSTQSYLQVRLRFEHLGFSMYAYKGAKTAVRSKTTVLPLRYPASGWSFQEFAYKFYLKYKEKEKIVQKLF